MNGLFIIIPSGIVFIAIISGILRWLNTPGKMDRRSCIVDDPITTPGETFIYDGKYYSKDKYLAMVRQAWQKKNPSKARLEKVLRKVEREKELAGTAPHTIFLTMDIEALQSLSFYR